MVSCMAEEAVDLGWKAGSKGCRKVERCCSQWNPLLHSSQPRGRVQARPRKRWEQDLVDFLAAEEPDYHESWYVWAHNGQAWNQLADKFVWHTCDNL